MNPLQSAQMPLATESSSLIQEWQRCSAFQLQRHWALGKRTRHSSSGPPTRSESRLPTSCTDSSSLTHSSRLGYAGRAPPFSCTCKTHFT